MRYNDSEINPWPALSDMVISFLMVLILFLALQVGRLVKISNNEYVSVKRKTEQAWVSMALEKYDVQIIGQGNNQRIVLGEEVLFSFGDASLVSSGKLFIQDLVNTITKRKFETLKRIEVNGHADAVGSEVSNMQLSIQRASGVVDYMLKNGLNEYVLKEKVIVSASGYGEFSKIVNTDQRSGKNRRIELLLTYIDV